MGASESTLLSSQSQRPIDEITTVSQRYESVDPILEELKSLKITTPILTSPPTEGSFTDILVRRHHLLRLQVLMELFSMYRDWQEEKAQQISKRQEEVENKIEIVDALSIKLLQRFCYSVLTMKTTSQHLLEVHSLQVELGELKGRLTEVISNCDALCKRISAEAPDSLQASITPFAVTATESGVGSGSSSLRKDDKLESSSTEGYID